MRWQPIESCPNESYDVLVYWEGGGIEIMQGHTARDYMQPKTEDGEILSHWMLLPSPPNAPLTGAATGGKDEHR